MTEENSARITTSDRILFIFLPQLFALVIFHTPQLLFGFARAIRLRIRFSCDLWPRSRGCCQWFFQDAALKL